MVLAEQMSAFRDMPSNSRSVKCHKRKAAALFDHLVGAGEQRWRNFDTERLGRPQVDDQFERCWLLNGEVGWFVALQDSVHVRGATPEGIEKARSVRHE